MQRRDLLRHAVQWAPALAAGAAMSQAAPAALHLRRIPSSGESVPAVGLGSWITFNVGDDPVARTTCTAVMRAFFADGGRLIDSSPMYGSSQAVIGDALVRLGMPRTLFSADKVWTSGDGPAQIEASRRAWRVPQFDLLQVHNLVDWRDKLPQLQSMKANGRLRYVGISTSEGRRHAEVEQIMRTQRIDFVQLSYNPLDREAEQRLLPLARERGIAVLVNRPFREGALLRALSRHPVPGWAREIGATQWATLVLKFIIGHPDVTCAIPATRQVPHVRENLAAATGLLPDDAMRRLIAQHIAAL